MKNNRMRKSLVTLLTVCLAMTAVTVRAQQFALIDMEYIMEQIPAYEQANREIESASKQWQQEVEKVAAQAKNLYTDYQQKAKSLTEAERTRREEAIVAKEKEVAELRRKYFGPEGELAKKRDALMQPIENKIYEAVKAIATRAGYAAVIDRASANSLIFASPDIDISDDVLARLGY